MIQCRHELTLLDTTFFCVELAGHQCNHTYRFNERDVQRFAMRAETAEAELRQAREDAARYDFLRRFDHFAIVDAMLDTVEYTTLDAAVDAARADPRGAL